MQSFLGTKTFIIAEAGVNHNGDIGRAIEMVDAASTAGADAIKFQTFVPEEVALPDTKTASYQKQNTGDDTQLNMIKSFHLNADAHFKLVDHCASRGITFLSSPFDRPSLKFLTQELSVPLLKIPSGEITNGPLLLDAARSGLPVIMSTGMCNLDDVRQALDVLAFGALNDTVPVGRKSFEGMFSTAEGYSALSDKVALLHCTTAYPTPFEAVNLRAIETLKSWFGLTVGYSDHTLGIVAAIAATALGSKVIEKHFTLDCNLPGPDHQASLEPGPLNEMVSSIRAVELAMGQGEKVHTKIETENIPAARKSLVTLSAIKKGEIFSEKNMGIKRPGTGTSPMEYWDFIDQPAKQDFEKNKVITS
tara:strand:+ start:461 stop:1549 length:1089 start_codon:yes stop_codon:yes gene_type:complete